MIFFINDVFMKSVAIYLRVSTSNQSVDSQQTAIQKYLGANDILDSVSYIDEGISGAKKSRPSLDRLVADVEAGKISMIISYSLSRISRSASHLLSVLELFQVNHVQFISITERIELNTPAGKLLVTVLGAVAELERSVITERVKAGLENAKRKGVKLGKPKKPLNRELLINLVNQKMSYRCMSKLLQVSPATISRELRRTVSMTTPEML